MPPTRNKVVILVGAVFIVGVLLNGHFLDPAKQGRKDGPGAELLAVRADTTIDGDLSVVKLEKQTVTKDHITADALKPARKKQVAVASENAFCMSHTSCYACIRYPECEWCASMMRNSTAAAHAQGTCMAKHLSAMCLDQEKGSCSGYSLVEAPESTPFCMKTSAAAAEGEERALAVLGQAVGRWGHPVKNVEGPRHTKGCVNIDAVCHAKTGAARPQQMKQSGDPRVVHLPLKEGPGLRPCTAPTILGNQGGIETHPTPLRQLSRTGILLTNSRRVHSWLVSQLSKSADVVLRVEKDQKGWASAVRNATVCIIGAGRRQVQYAEMAIASGCFPIILVPMLVMHDEDERLPAISFVDRKQLTAVIQSAYGDPEYRKTYDQEVDRLQAKQRDLYAAAVRRYLSDNVHVVTRVNGDAHTDQLAAVQGFVAATHEQLGYASIEVIVCGVAEVPAAWAEALAKVGELGVWATATPVPRCEQYPNMLAHDLAMPDPAPWYVLYLPSPSTVVLNTDIVPLLATQLQLTGHMVSLDTGILFRRTAATADTCFAQLREVAEAKLATHACSMRAADVYHKSQVDDLPLVLADPNEDTIPLSHLAAYRGVLSSACTSYPAGGRVLPAHFRCTRPQGVGAA